MFVADEIKTTNGGNAKIKTERNHRNCQNIETNNGH